jgi:hypothetical protein
MPPSEPASHPLRRAGTAHHPDPPDEVRRAVRIDWPAWIALAWAVVFAAIYTFTILEARAPALVAAIRRAVFRR